MTRTRLVGPRPIRSSTRLITGPGIETTEPLIGRGFEAVLWVLLWQQI